MEQKKEKTRSVGRVTKFKTQKGELIGIAFSKDHLARLEGELNDKGWVNLKLSEGQFGMFLEVDDWKPTKTKQV